MSLNDLEVQRKEILLLSGMTQEGFLEDRVFDLSLKEWGIGIKEKITYQAEVNI